MTRTVALLVALMFAGCLSSANNERPIESSAEFVPAERHACVEDPWLNESNRGPSDENCPVVAILATTDPPEKAFSSGLRIRLHVTANAGSASMGAPVVAGIVSNGNWLSPPQIISASAKRGETFDVEGVVVARESPLLIRGFAAYGNDSSRVTAPGGRALSLVIIEGDSSAASFRRANGLDRDVATHLTTSSNSIELLTASTLSTNYTITASDSPRLTLTPGPASRIAGHLTGSAQNSWQYEWLGPRESGIYDAMTFVIDYEPHIIPVREEVRLWAEIEDGAVVRLLSSPPPQWS